MIAKLDIQTSFKNGKTYLKNTFFTTPFKLINITEDKNSPVLDLMLMSSSPGILDGDEYKININLGKDCNVGLQTQSYQRLFKMTKSASQSIEVTMDASSSFCYIPHPTVPHETSNFTAKNKIFLSANCSLIWGEVLTCGRRLSGEQFKFSKYHNITEIFYNRRLSVKENLLIQPLLADVNSIGQFEGYTHQASLIYINEHINIDSRIAAISSYLKNYKDITFGVSTLPLKGIILRILGRNGDQLFNILNEIKRLLQSDCTEKVEVIKQSNKEVYAA